MDRDQDLYRYRAVIRSVYDGDTCTVDIDLGLGIWVHGEKLRLVRIDAPEVRGETRPAGLAARDFLRERIDGQEVIVQTVKDSKGKYGRYLAEIYRRAADGEWVNVNDELVSHGHAIYRDY
jgi:micrococcal nuclease